MITSMVAAFESGPGSGLRVGDLLVMLIWAAAGLAVTARWFRWEPRRPRREPAPAARRARHSRPIAGRAERVPPVPWPGEPPLAPCLAPQRARDGRRDRRARRDAGCGHTRPGLRPGRARPAGHRVAGAGDHADRGDRRPARPRSLRLRGGRSRRPVGRRRDEGTDRRGPPGVGDPPLRAGQPRRLDHGTASPAALASRQSAADGDRTDAQAGGNRRRPALHRGRPGQGGPPAARPLADRCGAGVVRPAGPGVRRRAGRAAGRRSATGASRSSSTAASSPCAAASSTCSPRPPTRRCGSTCGVTRSTGSPLRRGRPALDRGPRRGRDLRLPGGAPRPGHAGAGGELVGTEPWGRHQWERLADGELFDGMESWLPWLVPTDEELATDLLGDDALVVLVEPRRIRDRAGELLDEEAALADALASTWGLEASGDAPAPARALRPVARPHARPACSRLVPSAEGPDDPARREPRVGADPRRRGASSPARSRAWSSAGYSVVLCSPRAGGGRAPVGAPRRGGRHRAGRQRCGRSAGDLGRPRGAARGRRGRPGLRAPRSRVAVLTESDVTGRRAPAPPGPRPGPAGRRLLRRPGARRSSSSTASTASPATGAWSLAPWVAPTRDYLLLEYRGGDKLYLPTDQIDLLTPYAGGDSPDGQPARRVGVAARPGPEARAAVHEVAEELVALYRRRLEVARPRLRPGHALAGRARVRRSPSSRPPTSCGPSRR